VLVEIVTLVFFIVPEQLIMQQNILPCHSFIQLEFDVLDTVLWLHMDPEVSMIKDGIH
jgi:hypothetical protein